MAPTAGSNDGTLTWAEVSTRARSRLQTAASPDAGLDAAHDVRRMIEEVTGAEPGEYLTVLEKAATVAALARFDVLLERRRAGEPLQYVLGRWSFRHLDLLVDRRVLIPRPETEAVVEVALAELTRLIARHGHHYQRRIRVADLGTGSGAIALSLAVECKLADVWATDVSTEALAVARANLAGVGRAGARVQLRHGSWYQALPSELAGTLAVIVANPPYVAAADTLPAEVESWEPALALRSGLDGLDATRLLLAEAPVWLQPDGVVVLELSPGQMGPAREFALASGFATVEIHADLAGRHRCLLARAA